VKQLSGIDSVFLAIERPETQMNVVGTLVLRPEGSRREFLEGPLPARLSERLAQLPPLRRRIASAPLGLGNPSWLEDPDFDVDEHIRRVRLPAPGSDRQLAEFVAQQAAAPLDRSRPLWELWIVDGLADRRVALVFKIHHAVVDGVTSTAMLGHLLDADPGSEERPRPSEPGAGEPAPSEVDLLRAAARQWPARLRTLRGVAGRGARAFADSLGRALRDPLGPAGMLPFEAPRTPFDAVHSRRRVVATARAKRADVRFVKRVYGTTGNDVVLAACTHSLRNYLDGHGGIPDGPLVAAVPCTTRREASIASFGNRVSAFRVRLPVHVEDCARRRAPPAGTTAASPGAGSRSGPTRSRRPCSRSEPARSATRGSSVACRRSAIW